MEEYLEERVAALFKDFSVFEINEVTPGLLRTVVPTKKKNRFKTALTETAWKNVLQNLRGPERPQTNYQGRVVRIQRPVP